MNKKKLIDFLYTILCLYEDVLDKDKSTNEFEYLTYLNRMYETFLGLNQDEIACILNGLKKTGTEIKHKELKSLVFHMIGIIEKGEI